MKSIINFLLLAIAALPAVAQQFTEINPGLAKAPFPCVVWGDYDGDGDLDVLVAGEGSQGTAFSTIYNNTGGTFSNSGIALLGLGRASAAWGDFDNDGDLDLAMTGETASAGLLTRIYRNNGGTFAVVPGSFIPVYAGSVAWADYDGDGDLDLLVTGITSASPGGQAATRLYRNDAGTFTSAFHPFPNCYLGAVAWGDYDNDGDPDVVIAGTLTGGAVVAGLWRNDGGTFVDAGVNLPGADLGPAVWGDYDNDGDLDLLFGGNSNEGWITRIYRNDSGTFTDANAGLLGMLWSSAAWGDYDNDGDLDVMLIGYDAVEGVNRSILYRNNGGAFVDSGATFRNLDLGTVSWADYDNDGDLDLLLAGNESGVGNVLRISRNNTITHNTAPTAPVNLAANVIGTSVDFSWSAGSDAQTPTAALSYNLRVGTTPGGSEIVASHASVTGYRRLPALGNAGPATIAHLHTLVPGTLYYWSVQSVDTAFAGSAFAAEGSFTALTDTPLPAQVVSRKLHGGVPFDVDLPLTGSFGIECRSGGATNDYQVIFAFPSAVTFSDAAITSGTGSISSTSGSGTTAITLGLTSVTNAQVITVKLTGVNNGASAGDVSVQMGVLVGDTNGNGNINASDVSQAKSRIGQSIDTTNFRSDVNVNAVINGSDASLIKSRIGTGLP